MLTGGSIPPFEAAADALDAALPHGERRLLAGQGHLFDATAFAPVLRDFFR